MSAGAGLGVFQRTHRRRPYARPSLPTLLTSGHRQMSSQQQRTARGAQRFRGASGVPLAQP